MTEQKTGSVMKTVGKNAPKTLFSNFTKEMRNNWQLYSMGLPVLAGLTVFSYLPMVGLIMAFKAFSFKKGILFSPWAKPLFTNFTIVVNSHDAWNAIRNTVLLNCLFIAGGTIAALALAIMLNEIRNKTYKKLMQSITFLPFFMSWIVVGLFVSYILNTDNGSINELLASLGFQKIQFYTKPALWPAILLIANIWKGAGYSAVIYLATITGFSEEFYEAARIDGASRMQVIFRITLPMLYPTIIILVLLAIGNIMRADFGLFYYVTADSSPLYSTTDVIDTYIYRGLRVTGSIGISSAAGMFQSVVSLFFVLVFNALANRYQEGYGLF